MNICMVGYGMMGVWHSDALAGRKDVTLHTLVGRRPEAAAEFARQYGYERSTQDLDEALADPAVDAVILATPSQFHAEQAIRCLEAGKHTLVEIPIAMSLRDAERVVEAADRSGRTLAVCHPMRMRPERLELLDRVASGEETIRHVAGRFFIHRLKNVGATGYERSWTDNILWHHLCHFVDLGCFLLNFAESRSVQSFMPAPHPLTGIPMEAVVLFDTAADQSFLVNGSYHAAYRLYDELVVTDRDTYFYDTLTSTVRTRDGSAPLEDEKTNCVRVTHDFVDAVRDGRAPATTGRSTLPAMRVLQAAQDAWDSRHGIQDLPGRPAR